MTADPQQHDRFFVKQRFDLLLNKYELSTLGRDGRSDGELICVVVQQPLKLKEEFIASTDGDGRNLVFRMQAQQIWDARATCEVLDPSGRRLGRLRKAWWLSLLRSTWMILDAEARKVGLAREATLGQAVIRRVVRLVEAIPVLGDWLVAVPRPYEMTITLDGELAGRMRRLAGFRDRYVLELSGDQEQVLDRRVALALAVGIDAFQYT